MVPSRWQHHCWCMICDILCEYIHNCTPLFHLNVIINSCHNRDVGLANTPQWRGPWCCTQGHTLFGKSIVCIWGLCCQKQVSQAGISNYIPQFTVWCNYLSLLGILASDNEVLIFIDIIARNLIQNQWLRNVLWRKVPHFSFRYLPADFHLHFVLFWLSSGAIHVYVGQTFFRLCSSLITNDYYFIDICCKRLWHDLSQMYFTPGTL